MEIRVTAKANLPMAGPSSTGCDVSITIGQGDTDALDVNGDLIISGGNVTITAQSPFDYDGQALTCNES